MKVEVKIEPPQTDHIKDNMKTAIEEIIAKTAFEIERQAKNACPVDTGNLRGSIHSEIEPTRNKAYVGTAVEYAPYVEFGTSKMGAKPFLIPALNSVWNTKTLPALHNIGL